MNKKLLLAGLLIIQNIGLINASSSSINLFKTINQVYASQPTNVDKTKYINLILDNNTISLKDKIANIQALTKVITNDITNNTGWLYNDDQSQIDWLYEQKAKISNKLSELEWQAKSYAERAAWKTAKYTSIYLGIILAAYLSQDQLSKITGNEEKYAYGDLAWMPIEKVLELAKSAVLNTAEATKNAVTGETAQKAAALGLAIGQTAGEYVYDAASTVGTKGLDTLQTGIHTTSQNVADATKPVPPTWSNQINQLLNKISFNNTEDAEANFNKVEANLDKQS